MDDLQSAPWFRDTRLVAWSDTDPSGAYTFLAALRYVEDTEIALLRSLGVLDELYPHLPRIYVEAQYRAPVQFGDKIVTELAISRLGLSSVHFVFRLTHLGSVCADGRLGVAYVGPDYRAKDLPKHIRSVLQPYVLTETKQAQHSAGS